MVAFGLDAKDKDKIMTDDSKDSKNEFERAGQGANDSIVKEFIDFVFENKKWWMIPILLVLALVGLLAVLGSTGAAPFIYTLF